MRRIIILSAFLAFAFISCDRQEMNSCDIPISFGIGCETKSAINSEASLKTAATGDGNGVAVFGTADGSTKLFDNVRVYWDSDWKYDNIKFWTRAGHTFAAIYPYTSTGKFGSNGATFSCADGSLTLDCSEGLSLSSKDLMYSQVSTSEGVYTTVEFPMHHAFAALKFMVVNASTGTVTNIMNPSLTSLKYKGTATVDADGNLTWNVEDTAVASTGTDYASSNMTASLAVSSDTNDESTWAYLYAEQELMVLPQAVYSKGISFSFSYTSATNVAKTVTFDLGNVNSIKNWEVGKIYTYIATITSEYVRFNVIVRPWIEEEYELD